VVVRVRLRIERGGTVREVVALVNSMRLIHHSYDTSSIS